MAPASIICALVAVLSFSKTFAEELPKSCADQLAKCPASLDGEYWMNLTDLYPGEGQSLRQIYCHDMNTTTPSEFITLVAPPSMNFAHFTKDRSNWADTCALASDHSIWKWWGETEFSKIAIALETPVRVILEDYTFSTTVGLASHRYGFGGDCVDGTYGNAQGQFMVNLTDTGFKLNDQTAWTTYGYMAEQLDFSISSDRQVASARCGGYNGECGPISGTDWYTMLLAPDPNYVTSWTPEPEDVALKTVDVHSAVFARGVGSGPCLNGPSLTVSCRSQIECGTICLRTEGCGRFNFDKDSRLCLMYFDKYDPAWEKTEYVHD